MLNYTVSVVIISIVNRNGLMSREVMFAMNLTQCLSNTTNNVEFDHVQHFRCLTVNTDSLIQSDDPNRKVFKFHI